MSGVESPWPFSYLQFGLDNPHALGEGRLSPLSYDSLVAICAFLGILMVYPLAPRIEIVCPLHDFVVVCLCYLSFYSRYLYRFFGDASSAHD